MAVNGKARLESLKKSWRSRVMVWLPALAALVLVDQYVKEGYWFDVGDLFVPRVVPSHEQIVVFALSVFSVLMFVRGMLGR
ncbi:MAG: hypothetical protein HYU39_04630 [Thaumarchaeota archaeon]|nr:hypothetical protein [Nitrososphaerota archaeon]